MKKTTLMVMLAALMALSGCERKAKKPDANAAADKTAAASADKTDGAKADEAAKAPAASAKADDKTEAPADPTADDLPMVADSDINPKLLHPSELDDKAPKTFKAKFVTSKGAFVVEFHRDWSPHGADRAYNLIENHFYDGMAIFRVVKGFMAQFGIHANPKVTAAWENAGIKDDPVKKSNTRGMVTFAKQQKPNSRTTHLFINYKDNSTLDKQGFAPVGKVVQGMDVVDSLYAGYGDGMPYGRGPSQELLSKNGNGYLNANFPKLDYIKKVVIE